MAQVGDTARVETKGQGPLDSTFRATAGEEA